MSVPEVDMRDMLEEDGSASNNGGNSTPRVFQPPLRLRQVDRTGRRLGVMVEDHNLYPLAASLYLAQESLRRQAPLFSRLLLEMYDYLARNWPAENTRGRVADSGRYIAWRTPDAVASELVITRKAAVDKVRRANREQTERLLDGISEVPRREPWVAANASQEQVYKASLTDAVEALGIRDAKLILQEPDLRLIDDDRLRTGFSRGDDLHWLLSSEAAWQARLK